MCKSPQSLTLVCPVVLVIRDVDERGFMITYLNSRICRPQKERAKRNCIKQKMRRAVAVHKCWLMNDWENGYELGEEHVQATIKEARRQIRKLYVQGNIEQLQ
jgi:hypothetical protein